jgi:hypothetical protein
MAVQRGPSLVVASDAIASGVRAEQLAREQREQNARRRREEELAAIRANRLDFDDFGH